MIDEKRLDEFSQGLVCLTPKPNAEHTLTSHEFTMNICDCEKLELIRLARLGLWAEQYGIECLEYFVGRVVDGTIKSKATYAKFNNALSHLPQESERGSE